MFVILSHHKSRTLWLYLAASLSPGPRSITISLFSQLSCFPLSCIPRSRKDQLFRHCGFFKPVAHCFRSHLLECSKQSFWDSINIFSSRSTLMVTGFGYQEYYIRGLKVFRNAANFFVLCKNAVFGKF